MASFDYPIGGESELARGKPNARPRDAAATREALVATAGPLFAEYGYEATTVGQIARAAGFSPNLITRYFGGKEGLFLAATKTGLNLDKALPGDVAGFGERLATQIVDRWERHGVGDPLLILLRSASSRPAAVKALDEFVEREGVAPLVRWLVGLGLSETTALDRANAIQTFVLGTVVTRKLLRTGAVAAADATQLRAWLADVLQRLLGEVPTHTPQGHLPNVDPYGTRTTDPGRVERTLS